MIDKILNCNIKAIFIVLCMFFLFSLLSASFITFPIATREVSDISVGDINHDGLNEIVVGFLNANIYPQPLIYILQNDGIGNYTILDTLVVVGHVTSSTLSDLNNDGYPDLYFPVTYNDGNNSFLSEFRVYLNQGGYFDHDNYTEYNVPSFIPCGYYKELKWNNDDFTDFLFYYNGNFNLFINDTNGHFIEEDNSHSCSMSYAKPIITNMNNDFSDEFIFHTQNSELKMYQYPNLNEPYLTIQDPDYLNNYKYLSAFDLDHDGDIDIICIIKDFFYNNVIRLFENSGNGVFEIHDLPLYYNFQSFNVLLKDINFDENPEIIYNAVIFPLQGFQLGEPYALLVYPPPVGNIYSPYYDYIDLDNDGDLDYILAAYSYDARTFLYTRFNNGDGTFSDNHPLIISDVITKPFNMNLTNYPNPFNPSTTISFELDINSQVSLYIYNIKGQCVRNITNDQLSAGKHQLIWDGKDNNNHNLSTGIYFCKLTTKKGTFTKKMMLTK